MISCFISNLGKYTFLDGSAQIITILHWGVIEIYYNITWGGGLPDLLHYYNGEGGGLSGPQICITWYMDGPLLLWEGAKFPMLAVFDKYWCFSWPSLLEVMTIGHWPTCGGVQSGNDSTRSENQSNWCPNQNFNAMVTKRILTKARPGRSPFVYVRLSPAYFPFSRASSYWHIRGRPYIT